jgi:hypothetical protein
MAAAVRTMPGTIANRVFVGYPWNPYKHTWETLIKELHKRYPLHFLAIGREEGLPATQLLTKIMQALDSSSMALFDASTGNANVSLEYGYFRAKRGEGSALLFRDAGARVPADQAPIISDLAGAVSNIYRLTDNRLKTALLAFCERHAYVLRFNRFCRQRRYKGGTRRFLVRMIRRLDEQDSMLRREFLDALAHDTRKSEDYLEGYLHELHEAGLVTVTRGNARGSRVHISA